MEDGGLPNLSSDLFVHRKPFKFIVLKKKKKKTQGWIVSGPGYVCASFRRVFREQKYNKLGKNEINILIFLVLNLLENVIL